MGALAALGGIALVFGLASHRVLEEWNPFNVANLAFGVAALAGALATGLRRWRATRHHADSGPILEAALMALALSWGAILVQLAAAVAGPHFDWTFERRYALAPATQELLAELTEPLTLTLYYSAGDPRRRATRLLLEEIARSRGDVTRERVLDDFSEEEDYYGIGSSNSVVLELGGEWELVERPSEGSLYEALSLLARPKQQIAYATVGAGEGNLERSDDSGFTGLRAALETEGYELRPLPTARIDQIPADADLVLVVAPQRRLSDTALSALRRYLDPALNPARDPDLSGDVTRGGSLVAFLEPGVQSGVEEVLAEFGIRSADSLIVDPSSGAVAGDAPGLSLVAQSYSDHPVARNLNRNRMTFFRRARSFTLWKPQPADRLQPIVFAGGDSWLSEAPLEVGHRSAPEPPLHVARDYQPIAVAGSYERGGRNTRIVAFGDSDFASNRYLRALYNLDLLVNAVHWAAERESAITLRPKAGRLLQFPVPIQRSLNALYGIGLLVPELLVMAGAWVWLRRRSA
jgi:hypothetical protein